MKIGFLVCVDDKLEKNQMFGIKYMPVWAFTLATYLRDLQDTEIFLFDTRYEDRNKTPFADIFFISGINQDYESLIKYQKLIRGLHPISKIIIGGPITSSYKLINKLDQLESFDHIYIGDGEPGILKFVRELTSNPSCPKIFEEKVKFKLENSRAMDFKLFSQHHNHYYGGVLEVSRGCPFLCEFCDIRTKPDNNISDNKPIEVIIEELENFSALGINNLLFACDNFIGNHIWAEKVCDAIIELRKSKGLSFHIYTWLTVNLMYHPALMTKMKLAGFDMFFIGVESFGKEQLLETAKLQNVKTDMKESIQRIQREGFVVVAGMIFGFDTDPDDSVSIALEGIKDSGLISGDPSLLTALPGTPLYRRMEKSNRLRKNKIGLGGQKYVTNILYLQPKQKMIKDFVYFVGAFNQPQYQYLRYRNFILNLSPVVTPYQNEGSGYIDVKKLWNMVSTHPASLISIFKRFFGVFNHPVKLYYIVKALVLTISTKPAKMNFFYFWLFNWSNSILKYGKLSQNDFDIDSVPRDFNLKSIIPEDYETDYFEPIPLNKIKAQRQATIKALQKLIQDAK